MKKFLLYSKTVLIGINLFILITFLLSPIHHYIEFVALILYWSLIMPFFDSPVLAWLTFGLYSIIVITVSMLSFRLNNGKYFRSDTLLVLVYLANLGMLILLGDRLPLSLT
jgi:hypothetical protein